MSASRSTLRPGARFPLLQHVRAAPLAEQCRAVRSPSGDCAHQRSSLLVVSPRQLDINLAGDGCAEGPCAPHAPAPRVSRCGIGHLSASHLYIEASRAWEGATPSRSVRVHLPSREGREPPESLLATRGPQCDPRAPSEPHMCTECEVDAEGEIVLDIGPGSARIIQSCAKRESAKAESRGETPQAGTLRTGYWTRDDHNSQ